jgi:hypothetical protein
MYVYVYVCICIHTYIQICIDICAYMHTYVFVHTCTFLCMDDINALFQMILYGVIRPISMSKKALGPIHSDQKDSFIQY